MTNEKSETLQKMITAYLVQEDADDKNIIQYIFDELAECISGSPKTANPYWIFALEMAAKLMREQDKSAAFLADLLKATDTGSLQMVVALGHPADKSDGGKKNG